MHPSGRNSGRSAAAVPTQHSRGHTVSGVTVRSKLAAPLSTQTAGTRRAVHGGAGDGGSDAAWKQPGRRLANASPPSRLVQPTIASSLRASTYRQAAKQQFEQAAQEKEKATTGSSPSKGTETEVKRPPRQRVMTQAAKQAARARLWPTKPAGGGYTSNLRRNRLPVPEEPAPLADSEALLERAEAPESRPQELLEAGIQTNEAEILDHGLVLGEVRRVCPSMQLVEQIERERRELKAKTERQSKRSFAAHEQQEELHLDELKEFSLRNAVTKRTPKKPPPIQYASYDNQYQNVFKSMDDFFTRVQSSVPKSESVTNIQERIKRKEQELLSLFDNVDLND
ncbi:uncharacterized protein LOC108147572 [Drosophila elegans]|uniref:uncharacterized protein LOC108147572 n=1 Tax=Drosophila elegans TaxID=30023 RepID=UPI0007E6ACE3|nr:uncharacterized protein LOC108147572 [Drosophila elegans]